MMKLRLRQVSAGVALAYSAGVIVWFAVWLLVGDGWWWLGLLNRIAPEMLALSPLMALLALASRSRRAMIVSLVPVLICAGVFWPYVVPRPVRPADDPTVSVMTFNVLYSNTQYDAVADVILKHQPDLIALQEVRPAMMARLVERLSGQYPYHRMGDWNPFGTTAAFSRHPLIESYALDLRVDRPAVVLKVDVQGKAIMFISAHLMVYGLEWIPRDRFAATVTERILAQEQQVQILIDEVEKHDGSVILACDCNSKETSGSYRMLAGAMANAAREVGWIPSPPSVSNAQRDTDWSHIDYVFYRGALNAVDVSVVRELAGSDHHPVIATLSLQTDP